MGIKVTLGSLDEVDAKYHDLYTEKDGKFILTGVDGMKTDDDVARLTTSLTKERAEHKATKEKYAFVGTDLAKAQEMLDKYPELEAAAGGKLDDAAINKLVEGRLNTIKAPLQREIDKAKAELALRDQEIGTFKARDKQRAISDAVRAAGSKAKILDSAMEDAILLGERVFDVDDDGNVTTKEGAGVTPGVNPEVWLTDMQSKRSHWWGPSQGGGAGGNRGGVTGGGSNPWTREGWNMTQQGQILTSNRAQAEQLARAAGTTIGGPMPAPRNK